MTKKNEPSGRERFLVLTFVVTALVVTIYGYSLYRNYIKNHVLPASTYQADSNLYDTNDFGDFSSTSVGGYDDLNFPGI